MTDLYSGNTDLLLHMEGDNNSTTFIDSSGLPKTITRYGDTKISTAQSKWGSGSAYFDGSGDLLELTSALITSQDYTIEAWLYLNTYSADASWGRYVVSQYDDTTDFDNRFLFGFKENGSKKLYVFRNGDVELLGTSDIPLTTWTHIALSRRSSTRYLFVNGILENQGATTGSLSSAKTRIGAVYYGSEYIGFLNGYLQDLRITRGIARYTANFTPPARLPDPDPVTGVMAPAGYRIDIYDGGAFRIVGTVDELGVAWAYRVRLFERRTGRCIRETWSAPDGSYSFPNIAYRDKGYFVVAFDHGDNPLNAAIADLITPEPMP